MWEFAILLIIALTFLYRWATINKDFFKNRGIKYHPGFPLLGSLKDVFLQRKSNFDGINDLYNMSDEKVFGFFDQRKPVLMIRDPDLIKQITIKDFDHFVNHGQAFKELDEDNLFGHSMFFMKDAIWKDMRSTLSPFFTGSKMRHMFHLINEVAQKSTEYLKKQSRQQNEEVDVKDYFTRFTNDIIATTAFGLQVNSFENKDNEFYRMGKKVTTFDFLFFVKFMLFGISKKLMRLLKVKIFDGKCTDYFMRLVLGAMKYRHENNIQRPDMINMLMEARSMVKSEHAKSHNREWSDYEIVAQCFVFFFAGFETSSVLMSFAAHELMENPEVQQKLWEEIEQVDGSLEGKPITYEALQSMKYLDMVTSEVLRKWPSANVMDRLCNKDYTYEFDDGKVLEIKAGESIWLPMSGIHRDSKYYENPNKFDPERFSEENKPNIQPFTYFPFGLGPRNCIGSRFALLEAKAIIYYLLRDFRLEASAKTTLPIILSPKSFQMIPLNGFWLKLIPRNEE